MEKDHVDDGPICTESTSLFGADSHCEYLEPYQCNPNEELPDNTEEGGAMMVVSIVKAQYQIFSLPDFFTSYNKWQM